MPEPASIPAGTFELAERLARPVIFLRFEGEGQPLGAWRGVPSVALPERLVVTDKEDIDDGYFFAHWISVDASYLAHALPGCISIYINMGEWSVVAVHGPDATLHVNEGQALYGHAAQQRPHLNALFRHGSPDFQAWVAQEAATSVEQLLTWSDIPFEPDSVLSTLDQRLRAEHPMWSKERPVAQLGGWCWGWPDEAWDERENKGQQFMLVTYQESEPWIELWWTGQELDVIPRNS